MLLRFLKEPLYIKARLIIEEVLAILDKYGDKSLENQKRIINITLNIIQCDMDNEKKIIDIQRNYHNLYPAGGGLSEFYIWREF